MNVNDCIGLDFETYGDVNLPERGLDNYVNGEFFQPLIASMFWRDEWGVANKDRVDFVENYDVAVIKLRNLLDGRRIIAHNAPFEQAVLDSIGINIRPDRFIDSAVVARAVGAAGKLEAAAPQLLNLDKIETGWDLIKLFSIPGDYQENNGHLAFDPQIVLDNPDKWEEFKHYCDVDAELGYAIVEQYLDWQPLRELAFNAITMEMNNVGWHVDLELVERMNEQYKQNLVDTLAEFRTLWDPDEKLNLNSLPQLKAWCAERGIKASSFNENNVASLLRKIEKKLATMGQDEEKYLDYVAVQTMLRTKQTLGGSSLKKLDVILRNTGSDSRLRDQYLHCGAGQTLRTSGRTVQMQNIKRLGANPDDVSDIRLWDNVKLAQNLRQCFTATDPDGALIVGDFSSVESRGLAYLAGEDWKIAAYKEGKDLYKVLAEKIFSVSYNAVTKTQRQTGKVGELSCGYGAGPGAVVSFAEGMGVTMTEAEATVLVMDWRLANPKIVELWNKLDAMLQAVVRGGAKREVTTVANGRYYVVVEHVDTPLSLLKQHGTAQSIRVQMSSKDGIVILNRYFHGCYMRGRNICYYKPSELKSGKLWKQTFTNPKTKQEQYYSVYGGKLAGILTQSFCREIFFWVLREVAVWADRHSNVQLIGQFHDEMVLDWGTDETARTGISLEAAKADLEQMMSDAGPFVGFPLGAEIKHDYRYTK